ncbi:MAG TPA: DUF2314 domain-containing protein [Gemmatimonadaceae bacterium]|nr:DUF2314 domain-containing protein [Gemmatimonadaceae bacterium]
MLRSALALLVRVVVTVVLLPVLLLFWVGRRLFGRANIVDFTPDDEGMAAAIGEARATVAEFIARIAAPEGIEYPSVKVSLPVESGGGEHVWLSDARFEDGMFIGTIGNVPQRAVGFRDGELLRARPEEISDWSYVEDGRLVGGYTIRYIRSRMSPRDRKRLDAGLPFRIEEATAVVA